MRAIRGRLAASSRPGSRAPRRRGRRGRAAPARRRPRRRAERRERARAGGATQPVPQPVGRDALGVARAQRDVAAVRHGEARAQQPDERRPLGRVAREAAREQLAARLEPREEPLSGTRRARSLAERVLLVGAAASGRGRVAGSPPSKQLVTSSQQRASPA